MSRAEAKRWAVAVPGYDTLSMSHIHRCGRMLLQDIVVGPLPGLQAIELISSAGGCFNVVTLFSLVENPKQNES